MISSPHDTATTVLLARSAVRAGQMVYTDFHTLTPEIPLEEAEREIAMLAQFAFPSWTATNASSESFRKVISSSRFRVS